jgi:hypothetical protein
MRGGPEGKEERRSQKGVVVIISGGRRGKDGTRGPCERFGRGVAAIAAWNSCSDSWVSVIAGRI